MNPQKIELAVAETKKLLGKIPEVNTAILYGSVARGTATSDSDIDVLIVTDPSKERNIAHALYEIEGKTGVRVSPLFSDGDFSGFDAHLLESLFRHGKILVGDFPALTVKDLDLEPMAIVSYDMLDLSPSEKMKVYRFLDGYTTMKIRGRKKYLRSVPGFLKSVGGWRMGKGTVIIPEFAVSRLDMFFRSRGVKRSMVSAWIQRT